MQEQKPPKPKEIVKIQIIVDHLTAVQECKLEKEFISLVRRCCRKKGPIPCEGMESLEAEGVVIIDDEGLVIPVCVAETMDFMGVQQVKAKAGGDARAARIRKLLENVPQASHKQATSKPQETIKQATELPGGCPAVALVQCSSVHAIHAEQQQSPPAAVAVAPAKPVSVEYSDDFNAFWKAFPNKDGKGRAWTAWQKVKHHRPAISEIIAAIERAKKSDKWTKDGGRYISLPATWINDRGWEAELTPARVTMTQGSKTDDYSDLNQI